MYFLTNISAVLYLYHGNIIQSIVLSDHLYYEYNFFFILI